MTGNYEEKQIATLLHGRYLLDRGSSSGEGRPLLVGFHGYAENAERHMEKLRRIPGTDEWVVCAVSALHRFYHPQTQTVIASWMTRQDRELMIDDNVRYVAGVLSEVRRRERASGVLVLAGFSQGVAMAYRAASRCGFPCHGLLALAGDVPPDVADDAAPRLPPVLLGRGTGDDWYTQEKMDADLAALAKKAAAVETCVFNGGHDWTEDYFQAAGRFLESIRRGRDISADFWKMIERRRREGSTISLAEAKARLEAKERKEIG